MNSDLQSWMDAWRPRVEAALAATLNRETACPPRLSDALRYSLLAPGKRLRPVLVLLAAEAVSGDPQRALPAAVAIEMVHTYSLVHDDLPGMDDDDLRRGRPTCHKQFDETTAILVGDGLLTLAFQVLAEEVKPPELAARCCAELAKSAGVAGMVGGQMDDLLVAGGDLTQLESIHHRKTGALFRAALRMGGLIGLAAPPADDARLAALDRYALHLGLAFQIADDLLDVQGTEDQTGKRVGKDAAQGKLTYPGFLGVEESRRRLNAATQAALSAVNPLGQRGELLSLLVAGLASRSS